MFSKPLAFGLLALGCVTAAAGGAYLATRHNAADVAAAPPAMSTPAAAPAAPSAPRPVAETEAVVGAKPDGAAPDVTSGSTPSTPSTADAVEATPMKAPSPAPKRRVERPAPAVTATRSAAATGQRTVPLREPVAPPAEPISAPTQAAATPTSAEAAKPVEPMPEPPRAPQFEEVVLPASSVIGLQMETALSSERARVEDRVEARVTRDVMSNGRVAIPAGSRVLGSVTLVDKGGKLKERARLGIRFHTLVLADGSEVDLHTEPILREGESPAGDSAKKIGGAAVGGVILGAILGGGKGAAIGGATGAAGGTAVVMTGDRNAATLPSGSIVTARLSAPATIQVEKR